MTILASVNNKTLMPGITPIADVPDTPTIGTATGSALTASITFTPATTGGTATTYTATSSPGSITGTSSSSPVTVSGLSDGTSYTFTVRASNSTGSSAASAASNSITAILPLDGAYDALATVVVPSGGLSSITFAGIPTGYKHLQIRGIARTNSSNFYDASRITFNGDTGNNYSSHYLDGYNSGVSASGNVSQPYIINYYMGGGTASTFSANIIDILDYANVNKFKTTRSLAGIDANTAGGAINFSSGLWQSTSAITSITFTVVTNTIQQNSSFALYGVK